MSSLEIKYYIHQNRPFATIEAINGNSFESEREKLVIKNEFSQYLNLELSRDNDENVWDSKEKVIDIEVKSGYIFLDNSILRHILEREIEFKVGKLSSKPFEFNIHETPPPKIGELFDKYFPTKGLGGDGNDANSDSKTNDDDTLSNEEISSETNTTNETDTSTKSTDTNEGNEQSIQDDSTLIQPIQSDNFFVKLVTSKYFWISVVIVLLILVFVLYPRIDNNVIESTPVSPEKEIEEIEPSPSFSFSCPPISSITAIAIDVTGTISQGTAETLENQLLDFAKTIPHRGLIALNLIQRDRLNEINIFEHCTDDNSDWLAKFKISLDEKVDVTSIKSNSDFSPIMLSISEISERYFGNKNYENIPKRLIIASDMIESTNQYDQRLDGIWFEVFENKNNFLPSSFDLYGTNVILHYLYRQDFPLVGRDHIAFWQKWFKQYGGKIINVKRLNEPVE